MARRHALLPQVCQPHFEASAWHNTMRCHFTPTSLSIQQLTFAQGSDVADQKQTRMVSASRVSTCFVCVLSILSWMQKENAENSSLGDLPNTLNASAKS